MQRNKFDNDLKDKLGSTRMDPPADMWERISGTLAAGAGAEASAPEQAPMRPLRIRRPRKARWGYGIAASLLLCALAGGYYISGLGDSLTGGDTGEGGGIVLVDKDDWTTPEDALAAGQTENAGAQAAEDLSPAGLRSAVAERISGSTREPGHIAMAAGHNAGTETYSGITRRNFTDINTAAAISSASVRENIRPADTGIETRKATYDITSDMKLAGEPADWTKAAMAEDNGDTGRAAPFKMSLFTNAGGLSNSENVRMSPDQAMLSDFAVKEVPNMPVAHSAQEEKVDMKHKMPVSFGLNANIAISKRFSIETGATYTYMYSESKQELTDAERKTEQRLHYVGIPIGIKYDIIKNNRVGLYAGAGAAFDIAVSGHRKETWTAGGEQSLPDKTKMQVRGIMPSIGLNIGVELNINDKLSVYAEPGMRYYIPNKNHYWNSGDVDYVIQNYRTQHPLNFSLQAGFRIKFNTKR